jgi:hypothetical protein
VNGMFAGVVKYFIGSGMCYRLKESDLRRVRENCGLFSATVTFGAKKEWWAQGRDVGSR